MKAVKAWAIVQDDMLVRHYPSGHLEVFILRKDAASSVDSCRTLTPTRLVRVEIREVKPRRKHGK